MNQEQYRTFWGRIQQEHDKIHSYATVYPCEGENGAKDWKSTQMAGDLGSWGRHQELTVALTQAKGNVYKDKRPEGAIVGDLSEDDYKQYAIEAASALPKLRKVALDEAAIDFSQQVKVLLAGGTIGMVGAMAAYFINKSIPWKLFDASTVALAMNLVPTVIFDRRIDKIHQAQTIAGDK